MKSRMTRTRSAAVLTALVCAVPLAAGCSGGATGEPAVASLPAVHAVGGSPATPASASDPGSDAGRPQMRIDDTPEKDEQYRKIYADCLSQHGMGSGANGQASSTVQQAALAACKSKEPLPPPELDPATNPNYAKDVVAVVKCLNSHGIDTVIVPATASAPMSWQLTTATVPDDYSQINSACLVQAFGHD